jgi:hypothetical protein
MAVIVPAVKKAKGRLLEGGHAAEDSTLYGTTLQQPEPRLHLIHPARARRREVEGEARMLCEPGRYERVFLGVVVVEQQMDLLGGIAPLEDAEEGERLFAPVPFVAAHGDLSGGDVERGDEGRGAITDAVMGTSLDLMGLHRQQRLGAVPGLDLTLLINAEHEGVLSALADAALSRLQLRNMG